MKWNSACLITAILAAALGFAALPSQAFAARACFCPKKGITPPICGTVEYYVADAGGKYVVKEDGRAVPTPLPADSYFECAPDKELCPNTVKPQEKQPAPSCPAGNVSSGDAFGIYGSNTIGEKLMPLLIAEYAKALRLTAKGQGCGGEIVFVDPARPADAKSPKPPALTIDCRAEGSETGIAGLISEKADIAMMSRPITQDEVAQMRANGFPGMTSALHEHVLALDALSVIVSKDIGLRGSRNSAFSLDEIADIFSQSPGATNWSKFGGQGAIRLYIRDEKSGTREMFEELVMPNGKRLPSCGRINVECFTSSEKLVEAVAADPQGIGFIGYAYQRKAPNIRTLPIAGSCGLEQSLDEFDVKTEDYPLSRRLFLYTARVHSLYAPNFVNYLLSDRVEAGIAAAGYVNQRIEAQSGRESKARLDQYTVSFPREAGLDFDDAAMRDLRSRTRAATRLSISYRFRYNSTMLDTKALQDVQRLADYLTFEATNSKVMLLGFTDSAGDPGGNRQLSLNRAKAVESVLLEAGIKPDRIVTGGYGELMPVACNNRAGGIADELGRSKNRRVEAWLLPE